MRQVFKASTWGPAFMLFALLALLFVAACLVGFYPVRLPDLAAVLLHRQPHDPLAAYVVLVLRMPRALAAVCVGAAVALAGSMTQSVLQNPLAEPGVLGVSAGASFAAITAVLIFHVPAGWLPLAAFVGALMTGAGVLGLARGFGRAAATPLRIILGGVTVGILFSAAILAVVNYGEEFQVNEVLRWLTGSLSDVGWQRVVPILVVLPILFPVVLLSARTLRLHTLGEERAQNLGSRTHRARGWLLLVSAILVGASVAVAGPVAFIGLLVPNAIRLWRGSVSASSLLLAAMLGACLVLAADLLGRIVLPPIEIPYGLVTAILGAPYLLYLLVRTRWGAF